MTDQIEITDEMAQDGAKCGIKPCNACHMFGRCHDNNGIKILSRALIEERNKPKVWDGAPKLATGCRVEFTADDFEGLVVKTYTRTLQKSPTRLIVERTAMAIMNHIASLTQTEDAIEAAINEAMELKEGEK